MSLLAIVVSWVTVLGLAITAVFALVRIVRGPTILDRMVASDVILTTLVIAVGADMVIRGHTDSIPLMAGIAATAVLATIVVARYVKRREEQNTVESVSGGAEEGGSHV